MDGFLGTCGCLWVVLGSGGWLRMVVSGCGCLWVVFWVVVDGYGWLWVIVPNTKVG